MILGHPWLEAVNPIINWKKGTVTIPPTKDHSLALSFAHLAKCASYLSKHTHPVTIQTADPRKEATLNPTEHTGFCRYLSAELPKSFTEQTVNSFIINCIQRCSSCFITPLATATLNKLTMSTDLAMQAEAAKPKKTLPTEYVEYAHVFLKEAMDHVPPS